VGPSYGWTVDAQGLVIRILEETLP